MGARLSLSTGLVAATKPKLLSIKFRGLEKGKTEPADISQTWVSIIVPYVSPKERGTAVHT